MDLTPDQAAFAVEHHDCPKLTIKVGKNAGKSPSVASLYRALAEAEAATVDDGLPLRPKPVRIRRPEDPLTHEEIDLRERLQAQPRPNAEQRAGPSAGDGRAHPDQGSRRRAVRGLPRGHRSGDRGAEAGRALRSGALDHL
ncbi:hypothetical protein [Streptomyces sp. NBC_00057]|uniref:hypothetical protein n=1 Tax=Streptomyces sp. NBC_00057 TaxID=2975634 RepID=UPI00324361A1